MARGRFFVFVFYKFTAFAAATAAAVWEIWEWGVGTAGAVLDRDLGCGYQSEEEEEGKRERETLVENVGEDVRIMSHLGVQYLADGLGLMLSTRSIGERHPVLPGSRSSWDSQVKSMTYSFDSRISLFDLGDHRGWIFSKHHDA